MHHLQVPITSIALPVWKESHCRSKGLIKESDKHMREILDVLKVSQLQSSINLDNILQNDQRFLVMDCIGEEREDILLDYISDLEVKGPPPPPTATNPLERLRRIWLFNISVCSYMDIINVEQYCIVLLYMYITPCNKLWSKKKSIFHCGTFDSVRLQL